jgi:hypothetical protein
MNRDPIVEEVRRTRQAIFADCGDDLEKLLDRFKAAESQELSRVVSMSSIRQTMERRRDSIQK